jgi:ABC-type multidrug transport system fused ATPase/permease subunit
VPEKSREQFVDVLGSTSSDLRTMFKYAGLFCCNLCFGLLMLVIGSSGNFVLPYMIG